MVVAAPNRAHVPLAEASLRAGLAVVVDKPLATTAQAAARLAALQRSETGVLLTVFHNRRWDSDFLTLRRLLADGALGTPLRLRVAVRALAAGGRRRRAGARAARPGRRRAGCCSTWAAT